MHLRSLSIWRHSNPDDRARPYLYGVIKLDFHVIEIHPVTHNHAAHCGFLRQIPH
jgi:hypothetical protein